jgi:PKHD-type hydroxylase
MLLQLASVLSVSDVEKVNTMLNGADDSFASGKATAGWFAKDVKHNEQASGAVAEAVIDHVKKIISTHPILASAARPKSFVKLLVSRYRPGMQYGSHVDDALMGGLRTDLSFTLFLSDPASYDGGELVIEDHDGETDVKLGAGSLVLYPTTQLHRVNAVTRGERLVVVGWIRSFIRSTEQREALFELDQVVATLKANGTERATMNSVLKVRNTLTRMWAED